MSNKKDLNKPASSQTSKNQNPNKKNAEQSAKLRRPDMQRYVPKQRRTFKEMKEDVPFSNNDTNASARASRLKGAVDQFDEVAVDSSVTEFASECSASATSSGNNATLVSAEKNLEWSCSSVNESSLSFTCNKPEALHGQRELSAAASLAAGDAHLCSYDELLMNNDAVDLKPPVAMPTCKSEQDCASINILKSAPKTSTELASEILESFLDHSPEIELTHRQHDVVEHKSNERKLRLLVANEYHNISKTECDYSSLTNSDESTPLAVNNVIKSRALTSTNENDMFMCVTSAYDNIKPVSSTPIDDVKSALLTPAISDIKSSSITLVNDDVQSSFTTSANDDVKNTSAALLSDDINSTSVILVNNDVKSASISSANDDVKSTSVTPNYDDVKSPAISSANDDVRSTAETRNDNNVKSVSPVHDVINSIFITPNIKDRSHVENTFNEFNSNSMSTNPTTNSSAPLCSATKTVSFNDSLHVEDGEASKCEDTWESLYDDIDDHVEPNTVTEVVKAIGNVNIGKAKCTYLHFEPKDPDLDAQEYAHLVEIYDFPSSLVTQDLLTVFHRFQEKGFDIQWVDDTHAIGVFSSAIAAQSALDLAHPLVKVRPLSEATRQTKVKAKKVLDHLQPYKPRPDMNASVARNLVANALGLSSRVSKAKVAEDKKKLREARDKKKSVEKIKNDVWEGKV